MTAAALLATLRHRGASVAVVNHRLRIEAPAGTVTPELREALVVHKSEVAALLTDVEPPPATFDPDAGHPAAVLLSGTLLGDVWLVEDTDVLAEHPDILRCGLPVLFFGEIEGLRGKTAAELQSIGIAKAVFPTSRVLQ